MKSLLIALMLCFAALDVQAAMTACNYSPEPCDAYGNHYQCASYGWIGDRQFCSPNDVTTPRPRVSQDDEFEESSFQHPLEVIQAVSGDAESDACYQECIAKGGTRGGCYARCYARW